MFVIRNLPLLAGLALLGACAGQPEDQRLNRTVSQGAVVVEGVPGGIILEEEIVKATVVGIDRRKRTVTLQDEKGNRRTVQDPPDMRNFAQLEIGDRVTVTKKMQSTISLLEPGEVDMESKEGAAMILTPPEGSKPGLLVASTNTSIAVVKALDSEAHTATLQFADGTTKTYKVRPDLEIKPEYLNREVVIRRDAEYSVTVQAQ